MFSLTVTKIKMFTANAIATAGKKIFNLARDAVQHTETIVVLSLSAVGLNALAGELPFAYALPMWIEGAMVIPILSVLTIGLLIKSAEFRAVRRGELVGG